MEFSRRNFLKVGVGGGAAASALTMTTLPALAACGTTVWTLWAGQTKNVGTVSVWNDADFIYVKYDLLVSGYFGTLHLWIGTDLTSVPAVKNGPNAGTLIPGQFPFPSQTGNNGTSYEFKIALNDVKLHLPVGSYCGLNLYVVAHAEVNYTDSNGVVTGGDTGFGGDHAGGAGERWYYYGQYTICCDVAIDPPPPPRVNTAFAKGIKPGDTTSYADVAGDHWVFATDKMANPEKLPSLGLIRNRWGWCIRIRDNLSHTFPLWAGCGLNYTSKGKRVGNVIMQWNGTELYIKYDTFDGPLPTPIASLREVHVYAGDGQPTTVAPGRFGTTKYFDPPQDAWDTHINVEDTTGDGIWVIAHAVVEY